MSIEGNEANIKIVGKRFSDLSDLHNLLVERKKVRVPEELLILFKHKRVIRRHRLGS